MPQPEDAPQISSRIKNFLPSLEIHNLFGSLIIILPFLLFWRWVFKKEVLFWGTPLFQFWPWHQLVKTSVLAGEWPLWNPLLGNGTPLLANLQSAFFYPLNLLYWLMPVEHGLTFSVILHLILAGWWMYLYTRQVGLSPFAATLSGLTYLGSGYLIGRVQFVTMVNAAAWLPLLLLLSERMVTRRANSTILWLGLALAVQFLAGHAQLWFYGLWLLGAYLIFRSWQAAASPNHGATGQPNPKHRPRWWAVIQGCWQFGLAVGLSLLLAAGQLLPAAEFMLQSPRSSGAATAFALTYSFWPWRLITLLAPNFFGHPAQNNYWGYANYWEDHAYLGVLPLVLALAAIWHYFKTIFQQRPQPAPPQRPPCQQIVPFFAMLILASLILAMGWNTPIYLWVFDHVPGFAYFQAPARLLIWYTLAGSVLAGVGAQSFTLSPQSRRHWRRLLLACLGLSAAGLIGRIFLSGREFTFLNATLLLGVLLAVSIIILLNRPPSKTVTSRQEILWSGLALLFVAFDLLWFAFPLIHTLPPEIYTRPITNANFLDNRPGPNRFLVDDQFDHSLKYNHYFRFNTFGPLELGYWQNFKESLVPNLGVYAHLPSANNDDPLVVGRWQQLVNLAQNADPAQRARLLALMNVGHFIDDSVQNTWPVIYQNETMVIQRVPDPLPRAYFVGRIYQAKTEVDVLHQLTAPNFDPRREVIIMDTKSNLRIDKQGFSLTKVGPVRVNEQGATQISLSVDAPAAGFVVLTDTFYPGWVATVDDRPAPIWLANLAFRAVAVGAGKHEIVFKYRPLSFAVGLGISSSTLVMVVIIVAKLWPVSQRPLSQKGNFS